MKFTKASGTLGLAIFAAISSSYAVANDSGWYMGANIGQSRAKIDDPRIISSLLGGGFTTTSISDNNRDTGYKIFGGYSFNKNFSLEAGYFDLGKFGFSAATLPPGMLNGDIKLSGFNLDAVGLLPLTEKFSVLGRVGINYAEAKDSFTGTGLVNVLNRNPSKNEMNPKFGLGVQYDFTEALGMRVEAERYRVNDAVGNKGDIDLVSLGLVYRFGVKKAVPAAKVEELVIIAVAPEPELVVVIPPPPPAPPKAAPPPVVVPVPVHKKLILSADSSTHSHFDFNKSTLRPAGQQALDKFSEDLKGANFEVITVTGHADRIGSKAYNMKLSERRADVVKAYLIAGAGIPSDKITAKGVGESEPETKQGECKGKKSKKLIACLGPDRRVEVDVVATRTSQVSASSATQK